MTRRGRASSEPTSPALRDGHRRQVTASLVRAVDGVAHVALGPLALLASGPLASRTGVPRPRLGWFLGGFTAYGLVVLTRARPEEDPTDVLRAAVVGNTVFVACVTASLVVHDLTPVGRLLHLGSLGSAVLVGASAAHALRPRS